ncbi:MAG: MotA/TolQ/ExbB proton channel family protein, partial [Planctomycetota bacterium]
FVLAGLALLVALWKWLTLSLIRRPSKRQVTGLLDAVRQRDQELAIQKAKSMPGPAGAMLSVGAENLGETTDLIEEVMYEKVMATRLRANGLLPFIAICAASAPLLGLLGTVTGIIETFKNLTVFGSGDVKSLSGGISKALITTEYGLIVAIPSLLLHAFLSRKAKAIVGHMERVAVAFSNQVAKTPLVKTATTTETITTIVPDQDLVRGHVREVLQDLLGPMFETDRNGGAAAGRVSHVG